MNNKAYEPSFVVLENYSGPLDLLLQLIRKQEMDVFQIDIHKITSQYVEYLQKTATPDMESAGDFIRIASWLVYIKSKSLLPLEEQDSEEPNAEELKNKLCRLLVKYQFFQKAGEIIYKRTLLGRDCWNSPGTFNLISPPPKDIKIEISAEKGLFQLMKFYHQILINKKSKENYKVVKPIPSLFHRLKQIAEVFKIGAKLKFNQVSLIHKEKYSRLLSFLSILELSRAGFIRLFQKHLFSNIEIIVKKTITENAIKEISMESEKAMNPNLEETVNKRDILAN